MNTTRRHRHVPAFTLIELLVVIAVIALLISIMLPSLASARDTARTTVCGSNVRQLAVSSVAYATDHKGLFSTGPFDNRRKSGYGRFDEVGWVASHLNGGYSVPGKFLCPSNASRASQNLNVNRANSNGYAAFSQDELTDLIKRGYNTNYCQSWFMGYTATTSMFPTRAPDPKDIRYVQGPLKESQILGAASASRVPLFGDATADVSANPDMVLLPDGTTTPGAKALGDGPIQSVIAPYGAVWGRQNFTDFGAAHGRARTRNSLGNDRLYGQIGFADGHVELFRDTNADGAFGHRQGIVNGINTLVYDELEPKVYGGWLNRDGLAF
ncbi:MAG: type II secretion system protein [Phycisphaerales bacterium]|jgi:prepilin-type N-terminal cleavage/methylation domain-containing protein/prepilin-type processing-associated H-X9-DG protein